MHDFVATYLPQIIFGAFALVITLIILGIIKALGASKRRRLALREWSFRHGFDYTEGPMPAGQLAPIPPFQVSDSIVGAEARNITRGSHGTYVTIFDVAQTRLERRSNRTFRQTDTKSCALFSLSEPLPRFEFSAIFAGGVTTLQGKLLAEAVKLAASLAPERGEIIPFPDRPGFMLRALEDTPRVAQLFGEIHFFDDKQGWQICSYGKWLAVISERPFLVQPENYDAFVEMVTKVYDHFRHSSS